MLRHSRRSFRTPSLALFAALLFACSTDEGDESVFGGNTIGDGDGDGDGESGDGDGDGAGDGDGDGTGDGDGDGDPTVYFDVGTGDGDGDGDNPGGDGCERIDLVFVMDISASMMEEKQNLQQNFGDFIQVLDDHIAETPEFLGYRIGVTNSSINMDFGGCATTMGLDGSLHDGQAWNGDCGYGPERWMEGPAPEVADQFSCVADNPIPAGGGSDCGHEMPLHAIQAFGPKLAAGQDNEGFYDKNGNSLLVFVVITDEDEDADWTQTNPAETKAYLDELAGGDERYGVIAIAGPGPGSCEGNYGDAIDAQTLRNLTEITPNGFFGSICTGNLHDTLADALEQMVVECDELPPPIG